MIDLLVALPLLLTVVTVWACVIGTVGGLAVSGLVALVLRAVRARHASRLAATPVTAEIRVVHIPPVVIPDPTTQLHVTRERTRQ